MAANVIAIRRPFNPNSQESETEYNDVALRINRVRASKKQLDRERGELERQFLDGDLVVRKGTRRGRPLTRQGRQRRLTRLMELACSTRHLDTEESWLREELARMNVALEEWARETYGG